MVVIREPKTFYPKCDLSKNFDKHLKHETEFILKRNEPLEKIIKKMRLNNHCLNTSMEAIFMNTKSSKTNEPHNFVFNLSQTLNLRSSSNYVALLNLSTYYAWKNTKNNNSIKTIN